jgi:hypothetical protein
MDLVPTDLKEIGWGGMVWIDLDQGWDERWAVKNAGLDVFVP